MRIEGAAAHVAVTGTREERLTRAAQEFEAQLMKELLRPLTAEDLDGHAEAGSGGMLGDFGTEALGRAISARGGLGIAASILHNLSHFGTAAGQVPAREQGEDQWAKR